MKSTELRIGNWVSLGEVIRIEKNVASIQANKGIHTNKYFNIKPIPLTEDWLLKFGFEKCNELSEYFDGEHLYCYEYSIKGIDSFFSSKAQCEEYPHIKHVHQLQNLYFALCGEELTIKE